MKVLLVGPITSPIIQRLWEHLKKSEIDVIMVSHNAKGIEGVIDLGEIKSYFEFFKFHKINEIVKQQNPDVVHAHVLNCYGLMCAMQKKPLLVGLWGSDIMVTPYQGGFFRKLMSKAINSFVLKRASRLHTSALHVANRACSQNTSTSKKIEVFYWGFSLKEPALEVLEKTKNNLEKEFAIKGNGFIVFPRGLRSIYNPQSVARIIDKLVENKIYKTIIVLKGFSSVEEEKTFFGFVNTNNFCYVNRLLNNDELYSIYSRSDLHLSIPLSDSLGGGVVEPALIGSFPVLSNLPSYQNYIHKNPGMILQDFSEKTLNRLIVKIKDDDIINSQKNAPSMEYDTDSVCKRIIKTYKQTVNE